MLHSPAARGGYSVEDIPDVSNYEDVLHHDLDSDSEPETELQNGSAYVTVD